MKLRNLLFGTMIACAFVGCSNDDDPIPDNGQPQDGSTTLAVGYTNPVGITKAGESDATITSLSMLVFDANGDLEAIGTKTTGIAPALEEGADAIAEATGLTAGLKEVILLANVDLTKCGISVPTTGTKMKKNAVFAALNKTFNDPLEANGALTMNSKIYSGVNVAVNVKNLLGFASAPDGYSYVGGISGSDLTSPVKLYRNVAKIVLKSVKTAVTTDPTKPKFSDPKLDIKEIFILQGHNKTNLFGANQAEYGVAQIENNYISAYAHTTDGWNTKDELFTLSDANVTVASGNDLSWIKRTITGVAVTTNAAYETEQDFYVYENMETTNRTLLVVKGDFSYKIGEGVNDVKKDLNRYYTIVLGKDFTVPAGSTAADLITKRGLSAENNKYNGLLRNLQYNLTLTVTGPGYQTPGGAGDPTSLDVQCEVVAFGEVNQDVEI